MTDPLVSIVIPAYNASRWLEACVNSALAQSYRPIEIVIYDDCSTDNTLSLAQEYVRDGIKVVRGATNLGCYGGMMVAMRRTSGAFVLKLDSDDTLAPQYLAELMPVMIENPNLAFATCDFTLIDAVGSEIRTERRLSPLGYRSGKKEFLRYLEANRARGTCVLIRREHLDLVGGFDGRFVYNGDWWLYLRLLLVGDVYYSNKVLARYRVHMIGKSRRAFWEVQDHLLAWQMLPEIWPSDIPDMDRHLHEARHRFARVLLGFSLFETEPSSRPKLVDLILQTDDCRSTRWLAWLARTRFSSVLSWPGRLRLQGVDAIKQLILWERMLPRPKHP